MKIFKSRNRLLQEISRGSPITAFGESSVAQPTPITQISAQYGLLDNVLTVTDNAASGTTSVVNEKFNCETGTAADGLASITTRRQLAYKAGQGALARFTAIFSPGVLGSSQGAGLITAENLFVFGYLNSTEFGIVHARDGMDELQELTLTAAAGAETASVTIDGTVYSVPLTGVGTVQGDAYEIAQSLNAQVPNYQFTSNDNQVVAQAVISDAQGAFAYSSAGTSTGSWNQLVAGAQPTLEFIPQSEWNVDTRISNDADVNLDPQLGNVYQIQFQYLGFGAINFFVEDKNTGALVLVHTIRFANSSTTTSINNPTFRVGWIARNIGNTTNVTVQGASAGAFVEGAIFRDNPPRSVSHEQLSIGSTLTNILSFRNRINFFDKVNRAEVYPLLVSASTQATKFAFFKILLNPTFDSPVTFEYVDKSGSIVETTSDKVTVSNGLEIGTLTVVDGSSAIIEFNRTKDTVTSIYPGSTICIAAVIPSGSAADCQVSATWQEDL